MKNIIKITIGSIVSLALLANLTEIKGITLENEIENEAGRKYCYSEAYNSPEYVFTWCHDCSAHTGRGNNTGGRCR